jgi:hypothetical protein
MNLTKLQRKTKKNLIEVLLIILELAQQHLNLKFIYFKSIQLLKALKRLSLNLLKI